MVKAARHKARIIEVPVDHYPRRAGQSKVSVTIRGSILAAYYILGVTLRLLDPSGIKSDNFVDMQLIVEYGTGPNK